METKTISRKVELDGKISIPDEFRKALNITIGMRLDLSIINDSELLISKSKEMDSISDYLLPIANALADTIEQDCLITNLDSIIASNKKKYLQKSLTSNTQDLILTKSMTVKKHSEDSEIISIFDNMGEEFCCELIVPIISKESAVGSIIILAKSDTNFDDAIKPTISFSKYIASKIM